MMTCVFHVSSLALFFLAKKNPAKGTKGEVTRGALKLFAQTGPKIRHRVKRKKIKPYITELGTTTLF